METEKLDKKKARIRRGEVGRVQIAYYTFFKQNSHIKNPVDFYKLKKQELMEKYKKTKWYFIIISEIN